VIRFLFCCACSDTEPEHIQHYPLSAGDDSELNVIPLCREFRVETVINRMVFDATTTDPMQQAIRDSLIAFMAAMSQSQAEVTKEAQKAGIAHAQANDDGTKYRGRKPTFTCEQFAQARELLNQGLGISAVAKTVGLKRQSVYRIRSQPEKQMAALRSWYPVDFAQAT
jgi:putative DNA-invertase from lambdoid prophage Rac